MIVIIDFGHGNIASVENMLKRLGIRDVVTSCDPAVIGAADRLILPGVGAFESGMKSLQQRSLVEPLERRILGDKVPVLGICLGMQLLSRASKEGANSTSGLGWIDAETVRLEPAGGQHVPHMGWSQVHFQSRGNESPDQTRFYFAHSYHVLVANREEVVATANYGGEFVAALRRENIMGVQFHPEKSHRSGKELLRTFVESGTL